MTASTIFIAVLILALTVYAIGVIRAGLKGAEAEVLRRGVRPTRTYRNITWKRRA